MQQQDQERQAGNVHHSELIINILIEQKQSDMKKVIITLIALINGVLIVGQNLNNVQFPEMVKLPARKEIKIPDIQGYRTLKCDFHMHTVFSDGIVWPEVRVDEAWQEGLDAIAITDHIENQPSRMFISGDHNASYELALNEAKEKDIILIRAGEITRKMPPGHLNALFLNDVNKLDVADPLESIKEAKKQGAFILWNHPGWKAQQPDTCMWWPIHQELYKNGLINGIEVFNEKEYYPVVLDWCLNRKLAVMCNSDIHNISSAVYDLEKGHRPMTLVFAKERTAESIKEAMLAARTVAFFNNKLAGSEDLLKAIFEASLKIRKTGVFNADKHELFEITNNSAIPFEIENNQGNILTVPAESSLIIPLEPDHDRNIKVNNCYTGSRSVLHTDLIF